MGRLRYAVAFVLFLLLILGSLILTYPDIREEKSLTIENGSTLPEISEDLKEQGLIKSESLFNIMTILSGSSESLKSGTYIFEEGENLLSIISRLKNHDTQQKTKQVTLFEGFTRQEMAEVLEDTFRNFNPDYFFENTREGYLFPDTYIFFERANTTEIMGEITRRHLEVTDKLLEEFDLPEGLSRRDWVILASIVEREANTEESRRRVADILLRRLTEGMALQVDATFVYGIGKDSFTLTTEDLVDDHTYNTYTRTGLPPTPISNPGEDALRAILEPIPNTAVFFLTGHDGEMYYADTYDGHLENRRIHLNK